MGQALYCSAAHPGMWGERGYHDRSTTYAWLSSIALLPWLLRFPPQTFLTTIFSLTLLRSISPQSIAALYPWVAPQFLNSSPQPLHLLGDLHSLSRVCMDVAKTVWFSYRLPQVSFFTFSLKYFSSDSDNCPSVEIRHLLQFPHPPKAGPVLLTLLFPPLVASSYQVLHDSIYSFPLVRYFCLLSDGVLPTLLCLKVYSGYIHGERYTPHPPTPPPSCYFTSVFLPGKSTWTEEPGRLQSIASQSQTWLSN